MMAAVFLMHSLGQLMASVVGLVVLIGYGDGRNLKEQTDFNKAASIADSMWRLTVGVGGVPILVGLFMRLTIPETTRWTIGTSRKAKPKPRRVLILDVVNQYYEDPPPYSKEPHRGEVVRMQTSAEEPRGVEMAEISPAGRLSAAFFLDTVSPWNLPTEMAPDRSHLGVSLQDEPGNRRRYQEADEAEEEEAEEEEREEETTESHDPFSRHEIAQYFWFEGNWRYLLGISLRGYLLHAAFAILGSYDYRVIAQIWAPTPALSNSTLPAYSDGQSISPVRGTEIYNVIRNTATRSLLTVSIASVFGSLLAIKVINYVPRRQALMSLSLILAILLVATGTVVLVNSQTTQYASLIVLYALAQLIFSLGK